MLLLGAGDESTDKFENLEALSAIRRCDPQKVCCGDGGGRNVAIGGFDDGPDSRSLAAIGVLDDFVLDFVEDVASLAFLLLPSTDIRADGDEVVVFLCDLSSVADRSSRTSDGLPNQFSILRPRREYL